MTPKILSLGMKVFFIAIKELVRSWTQLITHYRLAITSLSYKSNKLWPLATTCSLTKNFSFVVEACVILVSKKQAKNCLLLWKIAITQLRWRNITKKEFLSLTKLSTTSDCPSRSMKTQTQSDRHSKSMTVSKCWVSRSTWCQCSKGWTNWSNPSAQQVNSLKTRKWSWSTVRLTHSYQ